jgi:hypothetical protein
MKETTSESKHRTNGAIEPLWTRADYARFLNVALPTFERWRSRGELCPADLMLNRMPRWRRQSVEKWMERNGARRVSKST